MGISTCDRHQEEWEVRLCVDMRMPNKAIKRERHPSPTVDDLIHKLNGGTVFSKLHLRWVGTSSTRNPTGDQIKRSRQGKPNLGLPKGVLPPTCSPSRKPLHHNVCDAQRATKVCQVELWDQLCQRDIPEHHK